MTRWSQLNDLLKEISFNSTRKPLASVRDFAEHFTPRGGATGSRVPEGEPGSPLVYHRTFQLGAKQLTATESHSLETSPIVASPAQVADPVLDPLRNVFGRWTNLSPKQIQKENPVYVCS